MELPSETRTPPGAKLAIAGIALAGVGVLLYATSRYGPGISTDSVHYLSAATSLLERGEFNGFDGQPLRLYPPLYPGLLACLLAVGLSQTAAALVLCCAGFGLTIFLAGLWVLRTTRCAGAAAAAALAVLASPHMLGVSAMAWSEGLFDLFTVLFLWSMTEFVRRRDFRSLLLAAIWASLGCLQRYLGATLVVAAGLVLILEPVVRWRRKLSWGAVCAAVAVVPVAVFFVVATIRKRLATGTMMPAEGPPGRPAAEAVGWGGGSLLRWIVPLETDLGWVAIAALFLVLGGLAGALAFHAWRRIVRKTDESYSPVFPVLAFALVYLGLIVCARTSGRYNVSDDRYLSPLYVPLVMILCYAVARRTAADVAPFAPGARRPRLTWRWAAAVAFAVWLGFNSYVSAERVAEWAKNGVGGWNHRAYRESPAIAYANSHPLPGPLLVTHQDLGWFLFHRKPVHCARRALLDANGQPARADWPQSLGFGPEAPSGHLVWFRIRVPLPIDACTMDELRRLFEMNPVRDFPDGTLYEIRPRGAAPEAPPMPATNPAPG